MPSPTNLITLNALKHHLGFTKALIYRTSPGDVQLVQTLLLPIGASQMDLYTGRLSVAAILEETKVYLAIHHLTDRDSYASWLQKQGGFAKRPLSDGSEWVFREIAPEAYVHVHPGRYSVHTRRVKANAWKTAIATRMVARHSGRAVDLSLINAVRRDTLGLPPMGTLAAEGEIETLLRLLSQGTPLL